MSNTPDLLQQALARVREALPEFLQQDDYLLAHGASLMSSDSHEIVHVDTVTKIVLAAIEAAKAQQSGDKAINDLREELRIADKLLNERNRVLEAIPECEAHGNQCIPHALEWIERAKLAAQPCRAKQIGIAEYLCDCEQMRPDCLPNQTAMAEHPSPAVELPVVAWKSGNEFLPFHPQASHVSPDYRDGWNACFQAAQGERP